jgi:hypothetical protein
LKTRKKSRRLVKKSKMKNCEVVIIVVSVLNSSNFSKKIPGLSQDMYPENPEIKKLILLPEKRRKTLTAF